MTLVPITRDRARAYVAEHHRHSRPPQGWLFGVGLEDAGVLVGVAMAGRPLARFLQDGVTVEITRVCTVGPRNANSRLYAAVCRAAAALGYRRAVTYNLRTESGSSLRAAGFEPVAEVEEREAWSRPGRPRYEATIFGERQLPAEPRVRWERAL